MRTIDLQNCTDFRDSNLKIIVDGENHVMRHQFLTIQVPDDKSFDVRVKYSWDGSPVYTFNPKEDMVLQISKNRRLINTSMILLITVMLLIVAITFFYENGRFILYGPIIAPLFVAIHHTIRRKKFFIIQEVAKSGKVM